MTGASPEKVAEVVRLATALADQILDAQIMKREVPPAQIISLRQAARFLQDHDLPRPPLMVQVLHEFAVEREAGVPKTDEGDGVVAGLTRFLGAFRREKGLADEQ
jgi:hypothetical protein